MGGDPPTDESVDILHLVLAGRAARADRPDRLIGNDATRESGDARYREHGFELAGDHGMRRTGITLGQKLAHTQHWRETGGQSRHEFARYQRIILAVQGATLGVANQHVGAADIRQHRPGNFTGESAPAPRRRCPALQADAGTSQLPRHLSEIDERRKHQAGNGLVDGIRRQQCLDQGLVLAARAMHLPVASNDGGGAFLRGCPWRRGMIAALAGGGKPECEAPDSR